MYVCICNAVTDKQIREAANEGAVSVDDLGKSLKVATCCGRCEDCARKVLNAALCEQTFCLQAPAPGLLAAC